MHSPRRPLLRRALSALTLLCAAVWVVAVLHVPSPMGAVASAPLDAGATPAPASAPISRTAPAFDAASVLSMTAFLYPTVPASDAGGGVRDSASIEPLTPSARQEVQQAIDANIRRLDLPEPAASDAPAARPSLEWPIALAPTLNVYDAHGIANFVDHDPRYPNHVQDYMCGTRSYDTSGGYNHAGTDFFTWPFPWLWEADSQVYIVAAAPGTIVDKQDGNFDQCCTFSTRPWNAVFVRQVDGSVAWYGHMKKYALTFKNIGDTVATGEYLGVVGSSGDSTGPHLHFELHNAAGNLLDPFFGPCNQSISSSWWAAQKPYYDSGINLLTTGAAPPVLLDCPPGVEAPHNATQFKPGDTVYFSSYYRDLLNSQQSRHTIYRPDGTIYQRWTSNSNAPYYDASYWYWSFTLSTSVPSGRWSYEIVFNGQTYQMDFQVGPVLYPILFLPLIEQ